LYSEVDTRFELPTPFRPSIAQLLDVDATRQAAFHGSADQLGSKERERDSKSMGFILRFCSKATLTGKNDALGENIIHP
jgi:hypothetical protein